ncbi:MAG: glutathione S-transferase family protein [Rhodospirillaceae bacterium]|jgi:glutathione S-transferase|nr:glutathione S-transferase family protein [Rhodospirillaceae bacterium]MBT5193899.1 glutathione S-transferase family protein [Rhodospirillaceae bacterium]MBT5895631.1 glutathione S-transferase family protein [Rhodospirillaceae bacterium]MBT6427461.1 glutathione S-transferase family protein [Rhodospirillaceae bacterium]MBT7755786.1 glutathione S-transferase family protein [Rhodospirillaceae bacterium]
MAIVFYDLMGRDGRNFSPYCWRTRLSLAHKGLDFDHRGTAFTEIKEVGGENFRTVPIIEDDGHMIGDSFAIAEYLEDKYPDRPSLFGGDMGLALCKFVHSWTNSVVHPGVANLVLLDIYNHVCDQDRDYIRASREKIFGMPLEDVQAGREDRVESFRASLHPLRLTVRGQEFLGGERSNYADYIVFGALQWARTISDFRLLTDDDPVFAWFKRVGDLFDGMGREAPGYY